MLSSDASDTTGNEDPHRHCPVRELGCRFEAGTGRLLKANASFLHAFSRFRGANLAELAFFTLIAPESLPLLTNQLEECSRQGWQGVCELQVFSGPDGQSWQRWYLQPLFGPAGECCAFDALGFDIRELWEAQARMIDRWELETLSFYRELHEGVAPAISGARYFAESLANILGPEHQPTAMRLVQLLTSAQGACQTMGFYMHHVSLPQRTLQLSLEAFLGFTEDIFGVPTQLNFAEDASPHFLNVDLANHVLRIVQEAVRNAHRHAEPSRISVTVLARGGGFEVVVENDGKPLDENTLHDGKGLGMHLMKGRARAIAGVLRFEALPNGTRLTLRVPGAHSHPGMYGM